MSLKRRSPLARLAPSPALVVASLALFVALGSTALAVIPAPDGAIHACYTKLGESSGGSLRVIDPSPIIHPIGSGYCGHDAKPITLASQREVAALKAHVYGCVAGRVNGYAAIHGLVAKFPSTYTTAAPYLADTYNCSGQPVQVLRAGPGLYVVDFPGNPGAIGFGSAEACVEVSKFLCLYKDGVSVSVTKVTSGTYKGAFQVLVQDSRSGAKANADVDVLIP